MDFKTQRWGRRAPCRGYESSSHHFPVWYATRSVLMRSKQPISQDKLSVGCAHFAVLFVGVTSTVLSVEPIPSFPLHDAPQADLLDKIGSGWNPGLVQWTPDVRTSTNQPQPCSFRCACVPCRHLPLTPSHRTRVPPVLGHLDLGRRRGRLGPDDRCAYRPAARVRKSLEDRLRPLAREEALPHLTQGTLRFVPY